MWFSYSKRARFVLHLAATCQCEHRLGVDIAPRPANVAHDASNSSRYDIMCTMQIYSWCQYTAPPPRCRILLSPESLAEWLSRFQRHQPDALSARWRSLYEANSDRDFTRDVTVDDRTRAASLVAASAVAIDEISGLAV